MKMVIKTNVQFLQSGLKQLLAIEKQNVINGVPRMRNKQFEALYALSKMSDTQIANSYYKLPTGFGKTVMFSYMAQSYLSQMHANNANKKLIILVPRLNLINQTNEKLETFAGFGAAEFSGRDKNINTDIIICTYQSLENLLQTLGVENIGMVFADEAHNMLGDKISHLMSELVKFAPIIGFTATPTYDVNKSVSKILSNEIYSMSLSDGVHHGVLSPAKNILYCSSIVFDLEHSELTNQGEFNYESIAAQIDIGTLTDEIADIYTTGYDEETGTKFAECKAIINCPNIKIAKCQADAINKKAGKIVACAFSSEMSDFETEKQNFINGKYNVACQVNTLTEGFDDPAVNLCINYPTHSHVKAEQSAGRVIRLDDKNPNKVAFIVDTVFKKHKKDTFDTALQTARHANQVLFKDVAGCMVLIPKEKRFVPVNNQNIGIVLGTQTTFKPYKIITSSEVLMELYSMDIKLAETEKVPEKTDEWLGVSDLWAYVIGNGKKISNCLKELQSVMPDKIQLRKPKSGGVCLCLHIDAIDEFVTKAGLMKQGIVLEKTDEWLGVANLSSYVIGRSKKISNCLKELQSVMPDKIQLRKPKGAAACLCLHIDAIDEFATKAGLMKHGTVLEKTDEWLGVVNLSSYVIGRSKQISNSLQELQSVMPDKIQLRKPNGVAACLCLHIDAIDEFVTKAGLMKQGIVLEKTDEWLGVANLSSYVIGRSKKISNCLKELQSVMPDKIQLRKPKSGGVCLCLHIDAIGEFITKAGLMKRSIVPKKTDEWFGGADLEPYIMGGKNKISNCLKELQSVMPDKIQFRKNGSHIFLCLHIDAIDEFITKSGLMKRGTFLEKTDDWLGSMDLTAYIIGGSSKISNCLKELQSVMPDKIQLRKPKGRGVWLCLHIDAIDEFVTKAGLVKRAYLVPVRRKISDVLVNTKMHMR